MKLIVAFIHKEDSHALLQELRKNNISVTAMESEGGFLRRSNMTFLMGVENDRVSTVKKIIQENCQSRTESIDTTFAAGDIESVGLPSQTEVPVGGATILVLDVEEKIKIWRVTETEQKFACESPLTPALLRVTRTDHGRKKVCFVRSGLRFHYFP